MKLLLTSSGLTNDTIESALEALLGKSLADARMIYVPTAMHAVEEGPDWAWGIFQSVRPGDWGHVALLELTALPGLPDRAWRPAVARADAIVVGGGNTPYLSHWLRRSGLAEMLPGLLTEAVYVGVSAGSMLAGTDFRIDTTRLGAEGVYEDDLYGDAAPVGQGSDETLHLVPFAIRPHLNSPDFPDLTLERIAAVTTGPAWVLDDASALSLTDGAVTVATDGTTHYLPHVQSPNATDHRTNEVDS